MVVGLMNNPAFAAILRGDMPSIPSAGSAATSAPSASAGAATTSDAPKLKDYLPFMKPKTFGPQSSKYFQCGWLYMQDIVGCS